MYLCGKLIAMVRKILVIIAILSCWMSAAGESFLHEMMLTSGKVKPMCVDVSYNKVHRRMLFDADGRPLCHITYLGNRVDSAYFAPDGTYMAAVDTHGLVLIQDGTTDYVKHNTFIALDKSAGLVTDPNSTDANGEWTSAMTQGKYRTAITRNIFYGPDADAAAEIAAVQARRDTLLPEYEARVSKHQSQKSESELGLIGLGIFGLILLGLVSVLTRRARPHIKYTVRTIVGIPALAMLIMPLASFGMVSPAWLWPAMGILFVFGIIWLVKAKSFFHSMGKEKALGNAYIIIIELIWTLAITLPIVMVIVTTVVPVPLLSQVLALGAVVVIFVKQDATTGRCPECHTMGTYVVVGQTKAGTLTEEKKDVKEDVTTPREVAGGLERERIRTDITTTSVFQRWRMHMRCSECGYEHSYVKTGELLSETKKKKQTITPERAEF